MSTNTNLGNTPVNQGYVQLIHMGETGGIDGSLRILYDGDGTASDLQLASNSVKISTPANFYIGSDTITEFIQDTVGAMFDGNTETNITATYEDSDGTIDLVATGSITASSTTTFTNKSIDADNNTLSNIEVDNFKSGVLDTDISSVAGTDTTLASAKSIKTYVDSEVAGIVDSAPGTLDTLNELAAALGDDANFSTTTATNIATKLAKSSNLSDLTNASTARSNLGLGSLAELSSVSFSNIAGSAIQTSAESFVDNDTSLMTSAAVNDRIESFGYTTNTGDMTGVSITASNPLDISQSNTSSGSYSATISLDATEFQGYLTDMTTLNLAGDELLVIDSGDTTLKRKAISEIRLSLFDATGFSSGISFDGSTADGVLTFKDSDEATVESNLTFDGSTLALTGDLTITGGSLTLPVAEKLFFGGGTHTYIGEDVDDRLRFFTGGAEFMRFTEDSSDQINLYQDTMLTATKKLYLDGGSHTYITESSADRVKIFVGGDELVNIIEGSTNIFRLSDNVQGTFGNADDIKIYHNSSSGNANIENHTGSLYITNYTDDGDIFIRVDDGGSNVITALQIDASETGRVRLPNDNQRLTFGADQDLQLSHESNNNYIATYSGNLILEQQTADKDIIFNCDDGSGGVQAYMTIDGSAETIEIAQKMQFPASHSADKIVMYSGGNEKIGTEANTLLFTADNYKYKDVGGAVNFELDSSGIPSFEQGAIIGGFGARTTGGTTDWNDSSNARSGNGFTLLLSTATNGPTAQTANTLNTAYYHTLSFEYSSYDNDGNMTQIGIPYYFANNDGVRPVIRSRYSGTWSNYHSIPIANSNGSIQGCKGTASNPSYVFNQGSEISEPDTGMFCPGANMIGFSNGGTEKIRIDDSGRLLVGNTSVHYSGTHLQVGSTSDSQNGVQIQTSTTGNGYVLFGDGTGASAYRGQLRYDHTNDSLNLTAGGTESVFLKSANLGIGTSTPDEVLHIFGSSPKIKIENSAESSGGILFVDQQDESQNAKIFFDASARSLDFHTDGAEAMTISGTSDGRQVGIGTTTPSTNLHILDASGHSQLRIESDSASHGAYLELESTTNKYQIYNYGGDLIIDESGVAERFRIKDSTGNIGIGTSSPEGKLHIYSGDSSTTPDTDGDELVVENSSRSGISILSGTGSGSVGSLIFGSSDDANGAGITWTNYNNTLHVKTQNTAGILRFASNNNVEAMTIDASGNVGIGETSIDAKLHLTTASGGLVNQKFESAGDAAWRMGIAASGTDFLLDDSSDDLSTPEFAFQNDGDFHADGDVIAYSTTTSSDERLKENIKEIPYGLEEVLKMKPVEYDWKEKRGGKHDIGVIAQDIEKLIPEIIKENKDLKTKEDFKSVDYGKMVAVLIKAIQEQQEQIEELKNG